MEPPAKHIKSEVDRLSDLPDDLVLDILSLMETQLAVQTSVLSTTYRYLWTLLPNLSFDSQTFPRLSSFDKFVTHVISNHDNKFKVYSIRYVRMGKGSKPIVSLVKYIVSQQSVQHLKVFGCLGKISDFVSDLFCCQSLRTLRLVNGAGYFECEVLRVPTNLCLPFLTKLYLENILFQNSDKASEECLVSFSECPNLVHLTLIGVKIRHLKIFRLICQVENLTFGLFNSEFSNAKIFLKAPKLLSFNLKGPLPVNLYFDDVPSLEVADIGGSILPGSSFQSLLRMLKQFANLKCLTISSSHVISFCSHVFSCLDRPPPFLLNVKSLKLKVSCECLNSMNFDKIIFFFIGSRAEAEVVIQTERFLFRTEVINEKLKIN